jgi:predicted RNA-binding protein with PUA-like domain
MACWLFKQEPGVYSWTDLAREGRTVWDGVTNALALKHLRQVQPGDRVFFYHTGKEKAVVGEMRVVAGPRPDPAASSPARVVVEVQAVQPLPRPVSLDEIKADALLADWDLVRLPRLSVMPVSAEQWERVEALGGAARSDVP